MSILRKTILDSKRDWDVKLIVVLSWAYRTTFKVTAQATPFSLVDGIEATLLMEFEVESLRVAVNFCLMDSQSLRNRLTNLEELDERRRVGAISPKLWLICKVMTTRHCYDEARLLMKK